MAIQTNESNSARTLRMIHNQNAQVAMKEKIQEVRRSQTRGHAISWAQSSATGPHPQRSSFAGVGSRLWVLWRRRPHGSDDLESVLVSQLRLLCFNLGVPVPTMKVPMVQSSTTGTSKHQHSGSVSGEFLCTDATTVADVALTSMQHKHISPPMATRDCTSPLPLQESRLAPLSSLHKHTRPTWERINRLYGLSARCFFSVAGLSAATLGAAGAGATTNTGGGRGEGTAAAAAAAAAAIAAATASASLTAPALALRGALGALGTLNALGAFVLLAGRGASGTAASGAAAAAIAACATAAALTASARGASALTAALAHLDAVAPPAARLLGVRFLPAVAPAPVAGTARGGTGMTAGDGGAGLATAPASDALVGRPRLRLGGTMAAAAGGRGTGVGAGASLAALRGMVAATGGHRPPGTVLEACKRGEDGCRHW